MGIGKAIAAAVNLDDLETIRVTVEALVQRRASQIVSHKYKHGLEVGVWMKKKVKGKKGSTGKVPCNARIVKTQKGSADLHIIAPVRYANTVIRVPHTLVLEPFNMREEGRGGDIPTLSFTA